MLHDDAYHCKNKSVYFIPTVNIIITVKVYSLFTESIQKICSKHFHFQSVA